MNTKAIERIKGYCCEVNRQQWEELVMVADEVGLPINAACEPRYAQLDGYKDDDYRLVCLSGKFGEKEIPFPDFLAKLRGSEEWQPKAGEMVEVQTVGGVRTGEYMGFFGEEHWVFFGDSAHSYCTVDPLRPTITRAEAEQQLGKRIID